MVDPTELKKITLRGKIRDYKFEISELEEQINNLEDRIYECQEDLEELEREP